MTRNDYLETELADQIQFLRDEIGHERYENDLESRWDYLIPSSSTTESFGSRRVRMKEAILQTLLDMEMLC